MDLMYERYHLEIKSRYNQIVGDKKKIDFLIDERRSFKIENPGKEAEALVQWFTDEIEKIRILSQLDNKSNTSKHTSQQKKLESKNDSLLLVESEEEIPASISFNTVNLKAHIDNHNKKNDYKLEKWIKSGDLIAIENHLFVNMLLLKLKKTETEEIINLFSIRLNLENRHEEIKQFVEMKTKTFRDLFNKFFENSPYKSKIENFLFVVIIKTLKQPLIIVDSLLKYPETLEENKKNYYRSRCILGNFKFANDKFFPSKLYFNNFISQLIIESKLEAKGLLNNVFIFFEQVINGMRYYNNIQFDYINSPLFISLFKEIITCKNYYESFIGDMKFRNILEVEEIIKISDLKNNISQRTILNKPDLHIEQKKANLPQVTEFKIKQEQEIIKETEASSKIIDALKSYRLEEYLKSKGYSIEKFYELIVENKMPYCIALLSEIEYLKYFEKEFVKSKTAMFKKLSIVFNVNERRIKGNINVLNKYSNEDKIQYTSHNFKEIATTDIKGL